MCWECVGVTLRLKLKRSINALHSNRIVCCLSLSCIEQSFVEMVRLTDHDASFVFASSYSDTEFCGVEHELLLLSSDSWTRPAAKSVYSYCYSGLC